MYLKSLRSVALAIVISFTCVLFFASIGLAAGKVIKFGAAISLTGKLSKSGKLTRDGYELWKHLINKKGGINVGGEKYKVDIKYYDDESNIRTSTKLVEKLIVEDKVNFMLGPYGSGPGFATSAITEKYKKLMVLPMSSSPKVYARGFKYLFGILATTDVYMKEVLYVASQLKAKPKKVANLYKNDLANISATQGVVKYSKEYGFDLVYNEKFAVEATDFAPELTAIKALNPDILLVQVQLPQFVMCLKQVKDLKINAKLIGTDIAVPQPDFPKAMGKDAEYIVGPTQWVNNSTFKDDLYGDGPNYTRLFEEYHGYTPDYHAAGGSAAPLVYSLGIQKAGSLDPEKVRKAILSLDVETFWGQMKFADNGNIIGKKMAVGQIQNGKYVPIYPEQVALGKFWYPKPPWE